MDEVEGAHRLLQNEKLKLLRRTLGFAPSWQEKNSFAENNQKIYLRIIR
jgi:hypothetical protein